MVYNLNFMMQANQVHRRGLRSCELVYLHLGNPIFFNPTAKERTTTEIFPSHSNCNWKSVKVRETNSGFDQGGGHAVPRGPQWKWLPCLHWIHSEMYKQLKISSCNYPFKSRQALYTCYTCMAQEIIEYIHSCNQIFFNLTAKERTLTKTFYPVT